MAPPLFGKLGVALKDLLSKKYDYHNELKVVSKANDITLEAGGNDKADDFAGYATLKHKDSSYGESEVTLSTTGKATDSKGKVKFNQFQKGLEVTVSSNMDLAPTVEITHKADNLNANAVFTTDGEHHSLGVSACYGMEGITLGVSGATKDFGSLSDYNAGAEYTHDGLTLSVITKKQMSNVNLNIFQKYSDSIEWGAGMSVLPEVSNMNAGVEYKLSKDTTVKAKTNTDGVVATAIEHRLSDNKFKVNLASEFDTSKECKATNFGVALTCGDF